MLTLKSEDSYMKRLVLRLFCLCSLLFYLFGNTTTVMAMNPEPELTAPSYVLMEETTGKIICARNETERRSPASITKIMTLILAFDALESGYLRERGWHADSLVPVDLFPHTKHIETVCLLKHRD